MSIYLNDTKLTIHEFPIGNQMVLLKKFLKQYIHPFIHNSLPVEHDNLLFHRQVFLH